MSAAASSASFWVAFAALAAAASALANCYNTGAYLRALRHNRIDECLAAALDFEGELGRSISLKERKDINGRPIPDQIIWDSYDDVWRSLRTFKKTLIVARRYNKNLQEKIIDDLANSLRSLIEPFQVKWSENDAFHTKAIEIKKDAERKVHAITVNLGRKNA